MHTRLESCHIESVCLNAHERPLALRSTVVSNTVYPWYSCVKQCPPIGLSSVSLMPRYPSKVRGHAYKCMCAEIGEPGNEAVNTNFGS